MHKKIIKEAHNQNKLVIFIGSWVFKNPNIPNYSGLMVNFQKKLKEQNIMKGNFYI